MATLILQGDQFRNDIVGPTIALKLNSEFEFRGTHGRIITQSEPSAEELEYFRTAFSIDINVLPPGFDPTAVRLLISDMDSTLIDIECMDEIADFVGIKPQVAAITAAAMRGELDFETSLRRRVDLVKGVDVAALDHVYRERLHLNPGAETLIAGLRSRGIKFALVSGGFTFFTERLRERLGLDYTLANELQIEQGKITGRIMSDIVGAEAKETFLLYLCGELGIRPDQAIAVGDGANDLKMLDRSGLGVAYHAKPAVQAAAQVVLNHSGLDGILAFLE